jgi:hypothetical protein
MEAAGDGAGLHCGSHVVGPRRNLRVILVVVLVPDLVAIEQHAARLERFITLPIQGLLFRRL